MAMMTKKQFAIIYLEPNKLTYFIKAQAYVFQFPPESVKELEIVNLELFNKAALNFIQTNKLVPATVMIVLSSDLLYEREFLDAQTIKKADVDPTSPQAAPIQTTPVQASSSTTVMSQITTEERFRQIQLFLDIVPIEDIASKTYKIDKGVKVIVTNKKLYESVIHTFSSQAFAIDAVVPITVINKEVPVQMFDQNTAKKVLSKYESIRQQSLLEENSPAYAQAIRESHHIQMTTKVTTKREYGLIGIFGCLILFLGFISYTTFFSPSRNRQIAGISKKILPTSSITPTIIPTATPIATESAHINKADLKIQISGGTELQVSLLKQGLTNNGYKNIISKPTASPATGKTVIIFSSTVPQSAREVFLEDIKQVILSSSVQETVSSSADVVINL